MMLIGRHSQKKPNDDDDDDGSFGHGACSWSHFVRCTDIVTFQFYGDTFSVARYL
jgi:hypothetical protein